MPFDVDSAIKAGYSMQEIAGHLAAKNSFDLEGALKSGYSPDEIVTYFEPDYTKASPSSSPAQALQPPAPETTLGGVASSFVQGATEGVTTELPSMIGGAMQYAGSWLPDELKIVEDTGKDLKDWAETKRKSMFGKEKKRSEVERAVYEGTKMLAPSVIPAGIVGTGVRFLSKVGKLAKLAKAAEITGDVAKAQRLMAAANKAAKTANEVASISAAGLFGLSQAQQTEDTADRHAATLEAQGDFEGATAAREAGQGLAPLGTGLIEAGGEYLGTKYLGKLFRLDEAGVAKRGAKNLVTDFLKTLGVEVGTEMGQQAGEAGIEKASGIRPDAHPLAEALDVVGPTVFMTMLTGGVAGAVNKMRNPGDSIDLLQEEKNVPDIAETIRGEIEKQDTQEAEKPSNKEGVVLGARQDLGMVQQLPAPVGVGEGFTFRDVPPDTVLRKAAKEPDYTAAETPESLDVEYMPLLTKAGDPYKTAGIAGKALQTRTIKDADGVDVPVKDTHEVVEINGGFGLKRKAVPASALPPVPVTGEYPVLGVSQQQNEPAAPLPEQKEAATVGEAGTEEQGGGPLNPALGAKTPTIEEIDRAANEAATSPLNDLPQPTEAQKEAGNYRKGHVRVQGLDISIENPLGSERSGTDKAGKPWSITMKNPYGYFKRSEGKDGDQVDVIIGPNPESGKAYVIDQVDPETGKFDEHKTLIGFKNEEAAKAGYLENYEPGWRGLGAVTEMPMDKFKEWVRGGRKKKPVAYKEETNADRIRANARPVLLGEKGGLEEAKPGQGYIGADQAPVVRLGARQGGEDMELAAPGQPGGAGTGLIVPGKPNGTEKAAFITRYIDIESNRTRMAGTAPDTVSLARQAEVEWGRKTGTRAETPVAPAPVAPVGPLKTTGIEAPSVEIAVPGADLQGGYESATIVPVTPKKGTANIPPETTPKAVGGNLKQHEEYWRNNYEEAPGKYEVWIYPEEGEGGRGKIASFKDRGTYLKWIRNGGYYTPAHSGRLVPAEKERIYYRKGPLPNGPSYNFRENMEEPGVSAYNSPEATSFAGLREGDWYYGKGRQTGTGSDSEPVIMPIGKWKKYIPNPSRPPEGGGQSVPANRTNVSRETPEAPPRQKAIDRYTSHLLEHWTDKERGREHAAKIIALVDNKDAIDLRRWMNGVNPEINRLFSALTGLPAKTQKEADASLRSLDPEKWDNWQTEKTAESEKEAADRAEKRRADEENRILDEVVRYNGKEDLTRRELYKRLVEEGYSEIIQKKRGAVSFPMMTKPDGYRMRIPAGAVGYVQGLMDKREAAAASAKPNREAKTGEMFGETAKAATEVIQDFGEKIGGAKKDRSESFKKDFTDDDIATLPLSKIWPKEEVDAIQDKFVAAFAHAARAAIPTKPQMKHKKARWVETVKTYRGMMAGLFSQIEDGTFSREKVIDTANQFALKDFFAKVRLLEGIDREQWGRIGKVSEHPDAYRYGDKMEDGNFKRIPAPSVGIYLDGRYKSFDGAKTVDDAMPEINEALDKAEPASNSAVNSFEVRGREGAYFINKKGDGQYHKLKEFTSSKEALDYRNEHGDELWKAWDAVKELENVTGQDVRSKENRPRTGADHRAGKDVTPEQFSGAFGFRGVEFGNWVAQGKNIKERQGMLNETYDALMDLADIVGIPAKAISLNGDLGLAFGSRGSGWASAHYEPGKVVINLTKTRGAGSLAHEWLHALDNYFQKKRGGTGIRGREGDYITLNPETYYQENGGQRLSGTRYNELLKRGGIRKPENWKKIEGVRPEVSEAFKNLVDVLDKSPMTERSREIKAEYWSRIIERAARSFENYVIARMAKKGYQNDYLANVVKIEDFKRMAGRYPYLLDEEVAPVEEAFDKLFNTIQVRETPKGTEMYSLSRPAAPGFYSQLSRIIESKMGGKMPIDQLRKMLKGNGVTDAEIENITGALTGTVTKQQVLDEIKANSVEFRDVVLGEEGAGSSLTEEDLLSFHKLLKQADYLGFDSLSEARAAIRDHADWKERWDVSDFSELGALGDRYHDSLQTKREARTHFSQYTEPGAVPDSYREMFVTVPNETITEKKLDRIWREHDKYKDSLSSKYKDYIDDATESELQELHRLKQKALSDEYRNAWKDGHSQYSDIQNPVVRIRFNERIVDNPQSGESKSYGQELESKYGKYWYDNATVAERAKFDSLTDKQSRILFVEEIQGPSDANQQNMPEWLRKRIYDIGVKRVLAYAKENGFDGVSWTTGDMQAARYDLSKQINAVEAMKDSDGWHLALEDKQGNAVGGQAHGIDNLTDGQLTDTVGKDLAKKIIALEGNPDPTGYRRYEGADLKVGGEGLKRLYDQTLPALFKKYGKEGIGETQIGYRDVDFLGPALTSGGVPFIPITEKTPVSYPVYSAGQRPAPAPITTETIQSAFPGQRIERQGTTWTVTLKNGLVVKVTRNNEIIPEPEALKAGYGVEQLSEGETIDGLYVRDKSTPENYGRIRVTNKGGIVALHHESVHFLEDFGVITNQEKRVIDYKIKRDGKWDAKVSAEENRAAWLGNELNAPKAKDGIISRIWAKIREWIDRLVNAFGVRTAEGLKRDIKTGDIFAREAGEAEGRTVSEDLGTLKDSITRIFEGERYSKKDGIPVRDVLKFIRGDASKLATVIDHKDLRWARRIWNDPQFMAKRQPQFKSIFDREMKRVEERSTHLTESLGETDSVFSLKKDDLAKLSELVWSLEGRKLKAVKEGRFIWGEDGKIEGTNPKHYEELRAFLHSKATIPRNVADAYIDLRKSLDTDLMKAYETQRAMPDIDPDTITALRRQMGMIQNYFPHHRYGNRYVRAVKDGEIVHREHFFEIPGTEIRTVELLKKLQPLYPGAKWETGKVQGLPDETYDYPIPVEAMEQVINAAANRMPDSKSREIFKEMMPQAVADVMKSRGWGSHMIQRKNIPGYEKEDILSVLYDYKAGLYGTLAKMQASNDFGRLIGEIDGARKPNLLSYSNRYVKDVLRNSDSLDRAIDSARGYMYLYYIGANIKTGVVNLTQNIIAGAPRLGMETSFGGSRWLNAAWADIADYWTKGRVLPTEEAKLLKELYEDGTTRDQMAREYKGRVSGKLGQTMNKAIDIAGLTMSIPEKFNRNSLSLAAFRVARAGKITNKETLKRLGLKEGQPAEYETAKEFAKEITNDAHFIYGRGNYPEWARGAGLGGKVGRLLYTLQSFSHKLLQLWGWMLSQEGGIKAVVKSMVGIAVLGGITSLPLFKTISALYRKMTGDDPNNELRKAIGAAKGANKNLYRDLVSYGLPAGMGVDIGGSLGIEITDVENPVKALSGVSGSVVASAARAARAYGAGQTERAIEELAPVAIKNIIGAHRMYTEGKHAMSGKPINYPGERDGMKLSAVEAVAKGFGFAPVSLRKARDYDTLMRDMQAFVADKKTAFANRFANARGQNDGEAMDRVREEVREWNRKWYDAGRPEFRINIQAMVKARGKVMRPPKAFRAVGREERELYQSGM